MNSTRLDQLLRLHQAEPQDPFCTYGLAMEYAKAEQWATALEWLEKTLALDANYFYAYYQKARMLAKLERVPEARATLEAAIARAKPLPDKQAQHAAKEMAVLLDSMH